MNAPSQQAAPSHRPWLHLAIAAGLLAGFVLLAALLEPGLTPAMPPAPANDHGIAQPATEELAQDAPLSLGRLEGNHYTIDIFAGEHEPLYTVYSAAGALIAELVTADELYRIAPEVDIQSMIATPLADVEVEDF